VFVSLKSTRLKVTKNMRMLKIRNLQKPVDPFSRVPSVFAEESYIQLAHVLLGIQVIRPEHRLIGI